MPESATLQENILYDSKQKNNGEYIHNMSNRTVQDIHSADQFQSRYESKYFESKATESELSDYPSDLSDWEVENKVRFILAVNNIIPLSP